MLSKITKNLGNDPLKVLFNELCQEENTETLTDKTALIQSLQHTLEHLDNELENKIHHNIASSIFSGFSVCLAISGANLLAGPLVIAVVLAASVGSAATIIGGSAHDHGEITKSLPRLKLYSLALSSSPAKDWGKLWHISGDRLFCDALVSASKGEIVEGKVIRRDRKPIFDHAVDYCAERLGITRAELIARASAPTKIQSQTPTISTATAITSTAPTVIQDSALTVLQGIAQTTTPPTLDSLEQAAVSIIDTLVLSASNKTLGGLVIIAAPGAGKTTFLGCAWGRLKQHHGNTLNSLAIVVKKSDLPFFKAFASTAYCIKDSPINVAVEIIKFIDAGMNSKKITRIFLDDFLAMNAMLENALKGVFIEPNSYCITDKKELGFVPMLGHLQATLVEAWTVGREYNLCLWVSSHSSNIADLPFCKSASARTVGKFIFLAKDNNREFLELALSNNFLISSDSKRVELKKQLDSLGAGSAPIVLSNSNNWQLGLVPEFIYDEYQGYRNTVTVESETVESEEDNTVSDSKQLTDKQRLESLFNMPSDTIPTRHDISKIAATILDIIRNGNPPIKFDAIRKSKRWKDNSPISATVREGINELISKELIEGNNEIGYTVTDAQEPGTRNQEP